MPRKKVNRSRSNFAENTTNGVGLIANVTYPSLSPQLMVQQKRSVNVNHLHSYHTRESSVPLVPGVMLNLFHSDHADPSLSRLLAPNLEHTSSNLKRLDYYFPVNTTSRDQDILSFGLAEMCVDSNQTNYLYPVGFAEKTTTDSKILDSSMSGVRSGERSIELNVLHSYQSDPSASQSMSVRSAERSIESNVLHSYHSDPPASQSMSVRSLERSIESTEVQNSELLNIKTSMQVTSFNPSMSHVRPAERSIELNQLHSYHFHPSVFKLHPANLCQGSIDSKGLESNHLVQNENFDLSISAMRSAERSLVLVLN